MVYYFLLFLTFYSLAVKSFASIFSTSKDLLHKNSDHTCVSAVKEQFFLP